MATTQTRIIGLDELKGRFAQLPTEIGKKVLRKGAGAGARVIKAAEIAGAPEKSGRLKRAAIIKFVREQSTDDQALYVVTFRQGKKQQAVKRGRGAKQTIVNLDAFYAKWVERGHRIVGRRKKGGTKRARGRALRALRSASSGRVLGLFFFAKALAASSDKALRAQVDTMLTEIRKLPGIT